MSEDAEVTKVSFLPFGFEVDDYKIVVVDNPLVLLVGHNPSAITGHCMSSYAVGNPRTGTGTT